MIKPGDFGPRPQPEDERKTSPQPHARPVARVVTPKGGFLAPLGRVDPDPFPAEEAPTPTVTTARVLTANKHFRVFGALAAEDQQLVHALAVRLLASASG